MSGGWANRRFWKEATATASDNGFTVLLDGRQTRTPAGLPLIVPTAALAEAVAAEWAAQGETVEPSTMPLTRSTNSAIDRVTPNRAEVAELVADYAGSDLVSYRATDPQELIARQARAWDPLIRWAGGRFGASPNITHGLVHIPQPPEWVEATAREVEALDPFRLTALHDLVAISGSLVIGFAVAEGAVTEDEGWSASRIDEDWQSARWGRDEEAEAAAEVRRSAFFLAARFWRIVGA